MKYLKREWIIFEGEAYNIATTSFDWITWRGAYERGYREPRYPVPAVWKLKLSAKMRIIPYETGTD